MTNICVKLDGSFLDVDIFQPFDVSAIPITLTYDQFCVEFHPYKWKQATDDILHKHIEDQWVQKLKIANVYNGTKFRYGGFDVNELKLIIKLSLTTYKDMVGTSQSPNVNLLQTKGMEEDGNPQKYISDALGTGVLAFTSDNHLILTKRAEWTGEYPNRLDRPGGHPEPDKVFLTDGNLKHGNYDVNTAVANELWSSPIDELQAEMGVDKKLVTEQTLLGLIRNKDQGGRPSMEFLARIQATAQEVKQKYEIGLHAEAAESTSLHLLNPEVTEKLLNLIIKHQFEGFEGGNLTNTNSTDKFVDKLYEDATPALKGALTLYSKAATHFSK